MRAKEFAEMCYEEKEIQLKEYMNGNESLVAKLKNELALSNKQENFKLYGEDGNLVFNSGELEIATYEAFYENKE